MRTVGLLSALSLLAGACTNGDDAALESAPADPTVTSESTTTTSEPATTSTTPTTVDPADDFPPFEERLLAFHEEFVVDSSIYAGVEPEAELRNELAWVEENTVDPIRQRSIDAIESDLATGEYNEGPGTLSNVVEIDWKGSGGEPSRVQSSGVRVIDCTLGRQRGLAPDGTILVDRASEFSIVAVDYVYDYDPDPAKERFYAKDYVSDSQPCDPVDYLKDGDGIIDSESDAELVRDVHTQFMTETAGGIDERVEGYEGTLASAEETATATALELVQRFVSESQEQGRLVDGGGYETNIIAVQVIRDRAWVVDCSRDDFVGYNAAGEMVTEPTAADEFELRETFLRKLEGQWKVEHFWERGDQPCDPADYS